MSEQGWLITLTLLVVCNGICDATIEQKPMPGGITGAQPADESVQAIADEVNTICVNTLHHLVTMDAYSCCFR